MSDPDRELLERWQGGDREAGNALVRRRIGEITWFFRNKVCNETDVADLVSQTFLGCLQAAEGFRGETSVRRFLFRVANNVLYTYIRKKSKRQREQLDFATVCVHELDPRSASSIVMRRREAQAFVQSLRRIPVGDQVVLELMYFDGLSGREIGEVLGIPEGTVRGRLQRGLQRLREQVQRELLAYVGARGGEAPEVSVEDLERWAREVRELRKSELDGD
ncbi:RNA polymerase sigma factor [Paraliomyxa miuraensis]|uniref:RNA polymerase sigma factor n=1 Tax=Paraliomyxa miuraensis TaxID=376150 RepID=UPI0022578752|nr:RNA polymerase sigma factor [Paraliomyxa miuraensis]MCX4241651.1 RNA polymerase sigma factor [Paraliomyxa miuraensis]